VRLWRHYDATLPVVYRIGDTNLYHFSTIQLTNTTNSRRIPELLELLRQPNLDLNAGLPTNFAAESMIF